MQSIVRWASVARLFVASIATGCASGDGSDGAANVPATKGAAPTIADLALDKTSIAVGKAEMVKATLSFEDADGDVDGVEGEVVAQGQKVALAKTPLDAHGQKRGSMAIAVLVGTAAAGTAEVRLWAVDKNGNVSNSLSATIEAK